MHKIMLKSLLLMASSLAFAVGDGLSSMELGALLAVYATRGDNPKSTGVAGWECADEALLQQLQAKVVYEGNADGRGTIMTLRKEGLSRYVVPIPVSRGNITDSQGNLLFAAFATGMGMPGAEVRLAGFPESIARLTAQMRPAQDPVSLRPTGSLIVSFSLLKGAQ